MPVLAVAPAAVITILAVLLIVLAIVVFLVAVIVELKKISLGLDVVIPPVAELVAKTAPVNTLVDQINGDLTAGVNLLEGLLVKKAGLDDAGGLIEGPSSRAPAGETSRGASALCIREVPFSSRALAAGPHLGRPYVAPRSGIRSTRVLRRVRSIRIRAARANDRCHRSSVRTHRCSTTRVGTFRCLRRLWASRPRWLLRPRLRGRRATARASSVIGAGDVEVRG